ncbi:MAG TPA: DUF72 domain-containing protein [Pseudonocardiaceae bacterium]
MSAAVLTGTDLRGVLQAEWLSPRRAGRTLRFLTEHRLPYVCVDMPQGHPESLPPVLPATADVAVVRFHGRSPTWTGRDASARFRYHYSGAELAHWADRVRELSRRVRTTHVVFANGFRDDAQVDAARFQELLDTTTPMPRWRRVGCRTGHGGGRPGRPHTQAARPSPESDSRSSSGVHPRPAASAPGDRNGR